VTLYGVQWGDSVTADGANISVGTLMAGERLQGIERLLEFKKKLIFILLVHLKNL
jgi:hypothetical protein